MASSIGEITIIGLLAGPVAKSVVPGCDPDSPIATTLLGAAGMVVATFLGHWLGWLQPTQSAGFIGAVLGAVTIPMVCRLAAGRQTY